MKKVNIDYHVKLEGDKVPDTYRWYVVLVSAGRRPRLLSVMGTGVVAEGDPGTEYPSSAHAKARDDAVDCARGFSYKDVEIMAAGPAEPYGS